MLTRRDVLAGSGAVLLGSTVNAMAQEWPQRTIRLIVAVRARRRHRHRRPHHRAVAAGEARPAGRDREPAGRRRHARQRSRRPRRQGRLHPRHHDRRPDHRGGDEQVAALRHDDGVRSDVAGRDRRADHRDAAGLSGQQREGAGRGRQGRSRQDLVREPGLRRHPAFHRRAVRADRRHQDAARAVPHLAGGDSRRFSASRWTCCSRPSRPCWDRCSPAQLKALAVTGKDRFPAVPNVPAAIESGVLPGYDVTTWYGFFAPRGMPPAVIAKLNKTINEILAEEAVRERLTKAGVVVQGSTPEAFGKHMANEFDALERGARGGGHPAAVAVARVANILSAVVPAAATGADDAELSRQSGSPATHRPPRDAPRSPPGCRNTSRPEAESPGSARPCSRW